MARLSMTAALLSCGLAAWANADDFVPFVIPADVNPKSLIALPPGEPIQTDSAKLTAENGKFYRGKTRFKVWGVNFCFSANFPTHKDAERVATRLAAFGVNSVRFHHMDTQDYPSGIWDPQNKNELSAEALDRLDYFIDQLAQRGIFANVNLHVGRFNSRTLGLPEPNEGYDKMVDIFTPELVEAQKAYARKLLGHVNAYRKVRYADDPAVGFVEITNEDSLFMWSAPQKLPTLPEFYAKKLREQFNAWLKKRYGTTEKLAAAWNKDATPLGPNLLATAATPATDTKPGWNLEQHAGCMAKIVPLEGKDHPGVKIAIEKSDGEGWHLQFNQAGVKLAAKKQYTISFQARAESPRSIGYNLGMAHEPWGNLGLQKTAELTKEWKSFKSGFTAPADDANARLNFQLSGNSSSVELSDITFQEGGGEGIDKAESLEAGTVAVFPAVEPEARLHDRMRFLAETEKSFFDGMRKFVKEELGCKSLVTGTIVFGPLGLWAQQDMDYIDAHAYWKHPHFPGRDWDLNNWTIEQKALVDDPNGGPLAELACSRLAGKPFTVSEYNHPAPNDYQAECVPMLAAFGAAQDWDGIWFFAYSHNQDWDKKHFDSFFDMHNNPAKWGFFVPGAILFRDGEMNPFGRVSKGLMPASDDLAEEWIALHLKNPLNMYRAFSERAQADVNVLKKRQVAFSHDNLKVADQGLSLHFRWFAEAQHGMFTAIQVMSGDVMVGHNVISPFYPPEMSFIASAYVPLAKNAESPKRFLLAVCGRCENAEMKFSADRRTVAQNWGRDPAQIEAAAGQMRLSSDSKWRCQALAPDGTASAEVPIEKEGEKTFIRISPKYQTMWYLLTTE